MALRDGRVLVAQRAADAHLGGTWEFPGGKIEPGEAPDAAARRELLEETGLSGGALEPVGVHEFAYPGVALRFHLFLVRDPEGNVALDGPRHHAWVDVEALTADGMPAANCAMVAALRARLGLD